MRPATDGDHPGGKAQRTGWTGMLIYGTVPDSAELAKCGTGIRAMAAMPLSTEKRGEGQRDVVMQIEGVWEWPGDILYADEDGIVITSR